MLLWHCSNYDDGDETSSKDQEQPDILQVRDEPITEDANTTAKPYNADEGDVCMPCLDDQIRMEHGVHLQ